MSGRRRGDRSPIASAGLHTTLLVACLIAVFPVGWVLYTSLKTDRDAWLRPGTVGRLGLANYHQVITGTLFPQWFANSLLVAVFATVASVALAATAGYAVSRMRFPGHRPLMWGFLLTQMFPVAVLIVPLYNIMAALHLLDSYLGLVIAYCTVAVPFSAWMLKGYFDTIPPSIDESGRIDGLSPFGTFWRLILPLARPGLAVTAFYSFITAWGEYAYAGIFMKSEPHYTLPVGMATFVGDFKAEWGLLTASSVLVAIPGAVLFFFVQRHLVTGLTAGGVKA